MFMHISLKVIQIIIFKITSVMFQTFVILDNPVIGRKHWISTTLFFSAPTMGMQLEVATAEYNERSFFELVIVLIDIYT